ncbi:dTDP-4-dehydrorhamnose reductase [Dysgonomonas sp. 216]|uniref:dTDP-4-dehydrorhamnose reductase n=1 Tax=Dysgonomonas sp. 216 TaxID=2302934 RepID=UPI0013D4C5BC|nr:dTDP-4-dehydrorhamnose reductase [Dysgonomonas sp. 216]NDW19810.1 dTDP-4-dehydrorhamnose reductase [Dysgonomonas sp. 216]
METASVKVLVTGSNGQLGGELKRAVENVSNAYSFTFTDVGELDITNMSAFEDYVNNQNFEYIINCAAYTAVDKAEDDVEMCYKINRDAVKNIAEISKKHKIKVIHISTDYVFDGTKREPYKETDTVSPQSVYGKSKEAGESELLSICPDSLIIRTAWLYSIYGNNFVKTMIKLGKERDTLNVVADQIGTPTNAADLAQAIVSIVKSEIFKPGIYHYSNMGVTSWFDFTVEIHRLAGINSCKVNPITTAEYPTKAKRPQYSVLDKSKITRAYNLQIPQWQDSLKVCIEVLVNT